MKTGDKIRFDKQKYDVNKEVAEISTLSSGEIDKYKYVINEELLLSIKDKLQNQLSLHVLHQKKLLKNKQPLKSKETNKQMLLQIKSKDKRL